MFSRMHMRMLAGLLIFTVFLAVPSLVSAGGWVVITLDQLPDQLTAGQPYPLGIMARQHGQRPWQVESLRIEARHVETGQEVSFTARPDQTPGHYQVDLLLPQPGTWEWGIQSGMFPVLQPMPALEVANGIAGGGSGAKETSLPGFGAFGSRTALLGFSALLAFAVGILLITRAQKRPLLLTAGAGLLILSGGLLFAARSPVNPVNAETRQVRAASGPAGNASTGKQLFLAKGCVVCHVNDRALQGSAEFSVSAGPNLTAYRSDPTYLRTFLKDPQAVKPGTAMPNLELKAVEIDALVRFINDQE